MFVLIKKEDGELMAGSHFVKNAVFYKDMFAFFDAYEQLTVKNSDELPNFCFDERGALLLDGVCLFMKIYSSELGFESLKLTLEYLKVLYFTIAGYADSDGIVDKKTLLSEFEEYKGASVRASIESQSKVDEFENKYLEKKKKVDRTSNKYAKQLVSSNICNILYVVCLVLAIVSAMVPFSFYFLKKLSLMTTIIVSAALLIGIGVVSIILKVSSVKVKENANDVAYSMQSLKKNREEAYENYKKVMVQHNRVLSEKYEYSTSFISDFNKHVKSISFDQILAKANEYKLMSYNLVHDIKQLFNNFKQDVAGVLHNISLIPKGDKSGRELARVYQEIESQDWLLFNNEIRFAYLKKFIECAEVSYNWKLTINNKKIDPFGIDAKSIAKEEIAFLKSKNDLFVSSSLDKFLNTKYAKSLNKFDIKNNATNDMLKEVKVQFISHFFDYDEVKGYNNLFYGKKFKDGVKIDDEILNGSSKIPVFVALKLKIIENRIGAENSDSQVVRQIAARILGEDLVELKPDTVIIDESDIVYPSFECDEVEKVDDNTVKYSTGGSVVIGYKPAN